MYSLSHVIYRFAVHLENERFVYFKERSEEESINRNLIVVKLLTTAAYW